MNPIHDPFSVAGKSVIVTGGGTGIGAAIARVFSERGAKVLIASRNGEHLGPVAKALRDDGGTVESITCDVRDADQIETMFDRAESAFGGVDVMINNHGASFYARAEELSPNGFATHRRHQPQRHVPLRARRRAALDRAQAGRTHHQHVVRGRHLRRARHVRTTRPPRPACRT